MPEVKKTKTLNEEGDPTLTLYRFPSYPFFKVVVSFPLVGFLMCVILALFLHKESATKTHCRGIQNWLPSISAAIGDETPERYVWRTMIAFSAFPRVFIIPVLYYNFFHALTIPSHHQWWFFSLIKAGIGLHVLENLSLLCLTYVSSSENYLVHERSFIVFMIAACFYMCTCMFAFHFAGRFNEFSSTVRFSLKLKAVFFVLLHSCFSLGIYFFFRHNTVCESFLYTKFAACEYLTVVLNMCFHLTVAMDFSRMELAFIDHVHIPEKHIPTAENSKSKAQ